MRLPWILYQTAMASGLALSAPFLLARRGRHYLQTLPGRMGIERGPRNQGALWIHAVSVGEVGVAATLARALPEELPLLITTVTPTGQARAREVFGSLDRRTAVAYLPFDLGFAVGPFYRRWAPTGLILVEGDYWPLLLDAAARRQLPVAVVNGRVGERAFSRMRRFPRLSGGLFFSAIRAFGVQTDEDRRRLIESGAAPERVHTTGNLKYDTPPPEPKPELEDRVRALAGGRSILVAGSTMSGEEELVLAAFAEIGGGDRALLVLAPRHPERWDAVARLAAGNGFATARRSAGGGESNAVDVLLLDTLGELAAIYAVADAAFIGGTLVPTGGHNPLEPAHFAIPTVVGPSMENFREIAAQFERRNAWKVAADGPGLAQVWNQWLREPDDARVHGERARQLLVANRGALERTLELLSPMLSPPP